MSTSNEFALNNKRITKPLSNESELKTGMLNQRYIRDCDWFVIHISETAIAITGTVFQNDLPIATRCIALTGDKPYKFLDRSLDSADDKAKGLFVTGDQLIAAFAEALEIELITPQRIDVDRDVYVFNWQLNKLTGENENDNNNDNKGDNQ